MCSACGIPTHVLELDPAAPADEIGAPAPAKFAALRNADCRRLIQAAQALFMLVSALWGVLFLTGSLRVWEACLLLVLHGTAGALWLAI